MAAGGGGSCDPLAPAGVPCAFSPDSQAYFALASTDGHLRVWETANNRLHQEYVPSAHLSGTCTCLAWAPARLQAKVERTGRRRGRRPSGRAAASRAGWRVALRRAWSGAAWARRRRAGRRRALAPRRGSECGLSRGGSERVRPDPVVSMWSRRAVAGPPCSPKPLAPRGRLQTSRPGFSACPRQNYFLRSLGQSRASASQTPGYWFCFGQLECASLVFFLPGAPLLGCVFNTCSLLPLGCASLTPTNSLLS